MYIWNGINETLTGATAKVITLFEGDGQKVVFENVKIQYAVPGMVFFTDQDKRKICHAGPYTLTHIQSEGEAFHGDSSALQHEEPDFGGRY